MEHFCFAAKHPGLLHHKRDTAFRMRVIACVSRLHKDPLLVLAYGAASDARDNLSGLVSECAEQDCDQMGRWRGLAS